MTHYSKIDLDRSFVPHGTPTFADLIARLDADTDLTETRRRDMISGLRSVTKALGLPAYDVPAHGRWLQPRLAKVMPAALGLKAKTWQNSVSNARSAMAHFGIVERRFNRSKDLTPEWQKLWSLVLASQSKTLQPALCRFVHFLSNRGVAPSLVCHEDAAAYHDALIVNEISKSPDVAYRAAVNGWNQAVRSIEGWPKISLPLQNRQMVIKLPDASFPTTFIQDVDQLIAGYAHPDPFSDFGPARALRPATLQQYRRQLIRFASEVVHTGISVDALTGLDVLLRPDLVERGLRRMLERNDGETSAMIAEVAARLRSFSVQTGQSTEVQKALGHLARRLSVPAQKGMTQKNRDRLRILQDDKCKHRLLMLPERLYQYPPAGKANAYTKALAREDAIAIGILLVCPLRIKNLAEISMETHLQRPGDGRVYLVVSEAEVKNNRFIEFELPAYLVRMIDRHLATRCPLMCPTGTPWLFPQRDGSTHIEGGQLASRMLKRVRKEAGLHVNAHLYRHFAVMNWLDANPGGYEVARRLLGHSEVSRTINLYSGLEVKSATRAFADLIETTKRARR